MRVILLALLAATSIAQAASPLAQEVHNKGWIVFSAPTGQGDWDLYIMRPDASDRRNITNSAHFNELGGRFSPDGKRLLYRRVPKATRINHDQWGSMGQLILAHADGSNPQILGEAGELPWASWSPDGKQIACLTKAGIEIHDLADKKVVRRMERKGIYQQLFWSPDGQSFTGTANTYGESWTVVRMQVSTGEVNAVNKFQNCTPDWFPDSRRIIFSSRPANQEEIAPAGALKQPAGYGWTQLWMGAYDGSHRELVYGEDGRHIYGGALSPDGRYVMFTRSETDGGLGIDGRGSPMALMRIADAPIIAVESKALRKLHGNAKDGPLLNLPDGWEPHWTFAAVVNAPARTK